MADDLVLVERSGRACTITLNRPQQRNSLNPEMLYQLADVMDALNDDPEIRVVVLRGAGEQAFCAGYDIGRIPTNRGGDGEQGQRAEMRATVGNPLRRGQESVMNYRYPVIAMIHGYAMGAGCDLATICDLRIAADTAKLGMPPVKLGVLYSHQGIRRFIDLVGVGGAKEIFLTGRPVDAYRAKEMGLVNRVVPAADLEKVTYALAEDMSENAPLSVSGAKISIAKLAGFSRLTAEEEAELMALGQKCSSSEDLKEGQRAFLEKRKPNFQGR